MEFQQKSIILLGPRISISDAHQPQLNPVQVFCSPLFQVLVHAIYLMHYATNGVVFQDVGL